MEYRIAFGTDQYSLLSAVNADIYQGFEPLGSMVIEHQSTTSDGFITFRAFYQPMVKRN